MKNAKSAKIYVMASAGRVKVGRSNNPELRRRMLQASTPTALTIVHTTDERDDSSYVETAAHHILAAKRLAGEWFDVSPDEAIAAVHAAIVSVERAKAVPKVPRKRYVGETPLARPLVIRLPPELIREVDELVASEPGNTRSSVMRDILERALEMWGAEAVETP